MKIEKDGIGDQVRQGTTAATATDDPEDFQRSEWRSGWSPLEMNIDKQVVSNARTGVDIPDA